MADEMSRFIDELRRDLRAARRHYSPDELLDRIEHYFRYRMDETAGVITDQMRNDLDLLYDLPNAPTVLCRALGLRPGELRHRLGRFRSIYCPTCRRNSQVWDERRRGGYEHPIYICRVCGTEMLDGSIAEPSERSES